MLLFTFYIITSDFWNISPISKWNSINLELSLWEWSPCLRQGTPWTTVFLKCDKDQKTCILLILEHISICYPMAWSDLSPMSRLHIIWAWYSSSMPRLHFAKFQSYFFLNPLFIVGIYQMARHPTCSRQLTPSYFTLWNLIRILLTLWSLV